MNAWGHWLVDWLADFYLLATALISAALVAGWMIRQPAKRYFVTAGAIIGLAILAVLCASPLWPRLVFIGRSSSTTAIGSAEVSAVPIVEPLASQMPVVSGPPLVGSAKPRAETTLRPNRRMILGENAHPQNQTSVKIDFPWLVATVFVVGAGIVSIWLIIGALRASRLCRLAQPAPDFALQELENISLPFGERAGMRAFYIPRLLVSHLIDVAAAWGLVRPTILLPCSALADVTPSPNCGDSVPGVGTGAKLRHSSHHPLTPSPAHTLASQSSSVDSNSLRMLLAHEWAHIRRGDLWLLAASRLLLIVLFAHPLYWMLRRRLRFDQELLADAAAAQICGRQEYAECLFAWARQLPSRRLFPAGALGIWNRPGQLSRRIAMLLDERIRPQIACSRIWKIAVASVVISTVVGISFVTLRPAPVAKAASPAENDGESKASKPPVPAEKTVLGVPSYDGGIAHRHVPEDNPAKSAPIAKVEMASVSGTCVDEQQKPIPNARVRLFRIDHSNTPLVYPEARIKIEVSSVFGEQPPGSQLQYRADYYDPASQRQVQETRSDEKGEFRFAAVSVDDAWREQRDPIFVIAQAPGKASTSFPAAINPNHDQSPLVSPLTITMLNAVTVRGRVTNSAGQPVAGAFVWKAGVMYRPSPGVACAITDADGRYEIADVHPLDVDELPPVVTPFATISYVSFALSVLHPDYADGVIECTKAQTTVDAVLQPPATLAGQVLLDDTNESATTASVQVSLDDGAEFTTSVDKSGRYSISRLPPGKWHVRSWTQDRPWTNRSIELRAGDNELDLRLPKGGTIKGRLIDVATGKTPECDPRTAFIVNAILEGCDPRDTCQAAVNTNDGTFSIIARPGKNQIHFLSPTWKLNDEDRWTKTGVEVAAGQTVEIELRLAAQVAAPPPLPKEPLSEKATINALKFNGGGVRTETIDGQEYVTDIYTIGCDETGPRDPELPPIGWLEKSVLLNAKKYPKLRTLGLTNPDGGDAALVPLRGAESLEMLCISGAPGEAKQSVTSDLTMAAFDHFTTLPNLKMLCVMSPHFDDRAFGYIDRWPKLEGIELGGAFTSAGVKLVRGKSKLKQLGIFAMASAKLGDDCLDAIGTLANLEDLGLCDADEAKPSHWTVTNDGLVKLAGLTKLNSLTLQCPQITNAGLIHLREMKSLKHLDLKGTAVTQAGIDELKKSLPKLEATGYQGWKPPAAETAAAPVGDGNQPAKR